MVPITNIIESLRPSKNSLSNVTGAGAVIELRGQYLPLQPLHRVFNIPNAAEDPTQALVIIVEAEGMRFGLQVDELVGQQQVVIKSLEANYDPVAGVSAATILGDGRVALILDTLGLHHSLPHHATHQHAA